MSIASGMDNTTAAYLDRLRLAPEPPSVDALFRLHRAQVERVPYETLWIHLGEAWDIDPQRSMERVALDGRGGYCFHLNGALSMLLRALGYDVARHVGGVHGPDGPSEGEMANHLVLTVHGLPSDDNPGGIWYVDAGLGDALHEPIPLRRGSWQQGPICLGLEETPGAVGDWHMIHDPSGSFAGMAWRSAPVGMDAFRGYHSWLSTSPDSGFVRVLTVQRRDVTGTDILRGLTFKHIGINPTTSTLTTQGEPFDVVGDVFGLDLTTFDPAAIDALWHRLVQAHEEWLATGPS